MLTADTAPDIANLELRCVSDVEEETEHLVIFELVVPGAAKVPAPRQHVEAALWAVQPASVTSTVPGKVLQQLRANNTALGAAWSFTATLAAAAPRRSPAY